MATSFFTPTRSLNWPDMDEDLSFEELIRQDFGAKAKIPDPWVDFWIPNSRFLDSFRSRQRWYSPGMYALKFLFFLLSAIALNAKPVVVSANTILSDFVRVVGGDYVEGICLLSPGMDPHGFEPKPADIRKFLSHELAAGPRQRSAS